ncbi:MAG: hypothetical protein D6B25_13950 [Desulfobulbaceae bacterium]|nr:MAG: hypothetical protein D6B25_13950 [Desulfobulbaceae bacterium]
MPKPAKPEIDNHINKLIVGMIALSLPVLTNYFSEAPLDSISASYHQGFWARDIFVGFLFAIAAFLFSYNGLSNTERILSKVAALACLGVALFPCDCGTGIEIIPGLHYVSAGVMFTILVVFCYSFHLRAIGKGHPQAKVRAWIYALCGLVIIIAMVILGIDFLTGESIKHHIPRIVFYGEAAGLIAFGIAWLTASRTLPILTTKNERIAILPTGGKTEKSP